MASLAGVAQWLKHQPANQSIEGSQFYSQSGHMPELQAGSLVGVVQEVTN